MGSVVASSLRVRNVRAAGSLLPRWIYVEVEFALGDLDGAHSWYVHCAIGSTVDEALDAAELGAIAEMLRLSPDL